jgi:hypothetical protein
MVLVLLMLGGMVSARQFQAGVNLVEVFSTVTDRQGRPLAGLREPDFVVEEDGVRQRIATFVAGEMPLAVAVALDRSFSMTTDGVARSVRAARTFLAALAPTEIT